ncbi:MAG: ATP-binding protein [Methanothrix sp.]|nr:ATP-binding protein [Methanothrix sp.]MDD4448292.1 ATP-binding protein [Methanothrix sp.]
MINKRYDQITKEDIEVLISNEIGESRTLDYKEQLPGRKDNDKKEFLADISSFANASGGYILYGISEKRSPDGKKTGLPEIAQGLADIIIDEEIRRMDGLIINGIEPRIIGVRIRAIDGFLKGPIIIIFIPKSWNSPHMVTLQTTSRFYSRNNAGKYPLDLMEIRSAFLFSETLPERIRRFRDDRIAKIIASETPIQLNPHPKIVLHILPISSFDPLYQVDLRSPKNIDLMRQLAPIYVMGWNPRYNFDGFLNYNEPNSYVQLFRNGSIEAVDSFLLAEKSSEKLIPGVAFEREVIASTRNYLKIENELGFQPPVFIILSITGIKDYKILAGQGYYYIYKPSIDRDILILPEAVIESYEVDIAEALRNSFDALWQAAGWEHSINYDENGKWIQK